ncbi:uncharacterized protein LOC143034219 [Oratosquilla oratoria]|uniref:uncharacterized protein LOC143034219 n=1 Tax=Oratosquilla oratoria TaxID=337810 RepID=UPI003F7757EA
MVINDALADSSHHWKYVDDSTVGIAVDNTAPDYSPLQATLDKLQAWTTDNHVTVNSTKTVTMHFCTLKKDVPAPNVIIGTQPFQVVKSIKLLGITIDDQLDWKQHVTNTVRAASYRLYMLRRLRSLGTPEKELRNAYSTFILPKLCYASPAWTPFINLTQERQLERVQKSACKIILGPSYSNYEAALTILNLFKLSDHHKETLRKFGFKLIRHPRHHNLLPSEADRPARATRHHNRLKAFKAPHTDRYKNSVTPSIVHLLNI